MKTFIKRLLGELKPSEDPKVIAQYDAYTKELEAEQKSKPCRCRICRYSRAITNMYGEAAANEFVLIGSQLEDDIRVAERAFEKHHSKAGIRKLAKEHGWEKLNETK